MPAPANRIGFEVYNPAQLKIKQEVITLVVFIIFSAFWLGTEIKWNHLVGFALMAIAAFFIFLE